MPPIYADPPSAKYYDLANIQLEDDGEPKDWKTPLKDNTWFKITNMQGWTVFRALIEWDKTDFDEKYISLQTDLNFNWNNACVGYIHNQNSERYFAGEEFDGNGHTIYNANFSAETKSTYTNYGKYTGLFYRVKNTFIHDLQIYNCIASVNVSNSNNYGYLGIGGIVGTTNTSGIVDDSSRISCCSVSDFTVNLEGDGSCVTWGEIGGICGNANFTIDNCSVKNFKVNSNAGISSDDLVTAGIVGGNYSHLTQNIDKCVVQSSTNSGVSYTYSKSEINGTNYSLANSSYDLEWNYTWTDYSDFRLFNNGYPVLKSFVKPGSTKYYFYGDGNGSCEPNPLNVPELKYGNNTYIAQSGEFMFIDGRAVEAIPNTGYDFDYWTGSGTVYTAHFKIETYNLTFVKTGGVIEISPSGTTSETVNYGSSVTGPSSGTIGTVTYYHQKGSVTYVVPIGYCIDNPATVSSITGETIIKPTIKKIEYKITFKGASNSAHLYNEQWTAYYNDVISFDSTNLTFSFGSNPDISYEPDTGYVFDYLKINGNVTSIYSFTTITVTDNIEIEAKIVKLITITLMDIDHADLLLNAESNYPLERLPNEMLKAEQNLECEYDKTNRIVSYTYGGGLLGVYKLDKFYRLTDGREGKIFDNTEIYPEIEAFACEITMSIGQNLDKVEMTVCCDNYPSENNNDGKFMVEFGTTVTFTEAIIDGKFTYTYRFSSGEEVTYTILNSEYSMTSKIESGKRIFFTKLYDDNVTNESNYNYYKFDGPEGDASPDNTMKFKTISPNFERKIYNGTLN